MTVNGFLRIVIISFSLCNMYPPIVEARPQSIKVVMDNNYPPYVFQDNSGKLQGILIDQWRLWEKKSGIKSEISAMDWGKAISGMKRGEFDVIDTIFKTDERSGWLDFTQPYAKLEVPIFFDKDISGITDAATLKGFAVAAKAGDAAVDLLKSNGVDNLQLFNSYETLIRAAKEHKVTVFVVDKPPALYFLHKLGIDEQYKRSAPLYVGEFRRAVIKGNSELLKIVEEGFKLISPEELKKIETAWFGTPLASGRTLRYFLFACVALGLLVLVLFISNRILRRIVNRRTEELKSSEERYRTIIEQAADGILLGSHEGVITGANKRMEQIAGRSKNELIGLHISMIFPAESLETVPLRFDLLQQGQTITSQRDLIRPDGSCISVEMDTKMMPDGTYQSIYHDITERKKAEKALRESEELLAEILELSPISMAIVCLDGTIEFINRRAIETFGYLPEDIPVMDRWWEQAYPDETYRAEVFAKWMDLVGKAIAGKHEIEPREYRVTCKDGRVKTTTIYGIPVMDKVFVIFEDITQRKKAEEERLNLERQMLHAQKLESLGVLSGGIAHDFNNLLQALLGNLDLALIKLPEDAEARKNINQAVNAGKHAAKLTNMMLAYSGKGLFVIKPISLTLLLEENATMLEAALSKSVTLDMQHLDRTLPPVMADAGQLQQVIMNLITNASEAIGDQGGKIRLSTGVKKFEQAVLNSSRLEEKLPAGRYVWMKVSDSGCGMDEETLQKLFDPFFTTKFTGRGLGMSAVLGIIRAHKGAFLVESRPGVGTTIQVLFPIAAHTEEERGYASVAAAETTSAERHRRVILVVDDEEMIRGVCVAMLEELGYEALSAATGEEALRLFRKHWKRISLVLLDQVMPGMDGVAVFNEMRRICPETKVLLISGFSEQEVAERFQGLELNGFLRKPFNLKHLADELQIALKTAGN
ncbi:MAG: transporter substrate-binding domain-containing protein [Desulfuromonadaceae bacterium]|nr:transporter substrate-binding domain-containing protein [Desulfuromonadaceae bacterium]